MFFWFVIYLSERFKKSWYSLSLFWTPFHFLKNIAHANQVQLSFYDVLIHLVFNLPRIFSKPWFVNEYLLLGLVVIKTELCEHLKQLDLTHVILPSQKWRFTEIVPIDLVIICSEKVAVLIPFGQVFNMFSL